MKCPVCKDKDLVMSERQGVEIDYCPNCRGIWLDRGELDKILAKSQERDAAEQTAAQTAPPQQPQYQQPQAPHYPPPQAQYPHHPQYGYGKPYKRKKSFFEELFD